MLSKEEKQKINDDVVNGINAILDEYELPSHVDNLTILNLSGGTTFMGNFRIHDKKLLDDVNTRAKNVLSKYGDVKYKCKRVVPCCDLPYHAVSFNFKIENEN